MYLRNFALLFLLALTILSFQNCSVKTTPRSPIKAPVQEASKFETYFLAGDPLNFIAGANLQTQSPLTIETLQAFNDSILLGQITIANYYDSTSGHEEEIDQEKLEEMNASASEDLTLAVQPKYKVLLSDSGVELKGESVALNLKFKFNNTGNLSLDTIKVSNTTIKVTPLHYSIKDDGSAFSIMMKASEEVADKKFSYLMAFYFGKSGDLSEEQKQSFRTGNQEFQYIDGPGVLVRWPLDRTLTISLCGVNDFSDHFTV